MVRFSYFQEDPNDCGYGFWTNGFFARKRKSPNNQFQIAVGVVCIHFLTNVPMEKA